MTQDQRLRRQSGRQSGYKSLQQGPLQYPFQPDQQLPPVQSNIHQKKPQKQNALPFHLEYTDFTYNSLKDKNTGPKTHNTCQKARRNTVKHPCHLISYTLKIL